VDAVAQVSVVPAAPPRRADAGWVAELELGFRARGTQTILAHRQHVGPLQVQRPFYPDGERACHVYILHPPGGVVGGDSLLISADVESGAHALLTTPAAGKLYRSDEDVARLTQELKVADGAWLEWLPQETIAFDGARAVSATRVALTGTAGFIGWEILCLGRPAAGETYAHGEFVQRFEIWRDGTPLWWERNALLGGAPVLHTPWGLAGRSVVATLVAVGHAPSALPALRELLNAEHDDSEFAVSQLRDVLVCRYLGNSAEQARTGFIAAWRLLRPALWGIEASPPRIWAT
jgi:urease accessory protein